MAQHKSGGALRIHSCSTIGLLSDTVGLLSGYSQANVDRVSVYSQAVV